MKKRQRSAKKHHCDPASPAARGTTILPAQQLGKNARRIREEQQLALVEVARSAGISAGMLSRLETGAASPSLETITSLAAALGVPPAALFTDPLMAAGEAQWVRAGQGLEVVRRGTRKRHTYHLLASQRGPRKEFEPFLVTLTDKSEVFPGFQHPGTEFLYILSGSLTYRHGSQSYRLSTGDSLTFRGDVAHGPEHLESVPIRMLSIIMYVDP